MTGKEAKSTKAAKQLEEDKQRRDGASEGDSFLSEIGDIGNFDMPDLDGISLNLADFLPSDEMEETRYTLPKLVHYDEEEFVLYENAEKLAHDLKPITKGSRCDAFIAGSFIYGDFIEAFMRENRCHTSEMTISTLSLSQDNVDSLEGLMTHGYIDKLNLIISVYFWAHERYALLPYMYKHLDIGQSEDGTGGRFQLAVAGMHTKTCHFKTDGGKYIVMHGSANLRSSGSIEQFTLEENEQLFNFYDEQFSKILEKYGTIKKPIRNSRAWDIFTKKYFKD